MSIVLIQTATSPNAAYTRLLYTVKDSVYTTQPQFQYVLDVYEGSTLLKRMTQGINPEGSATFDVSRIIQGELEADYNWKISTLTPFNSSSKEFSIRAGEQFGTSISSSVTVYPDQATGSLATFQGVVEPNAGTYNFIATQQVLSNMPTTMSMQSDDYGTISIYNDQGTYVSQSFYSASSTSGTYDLVDQKNYSTSGTYFNAVPISSSANYWNYVDVSISSSFGTENYRYEASDETHREKTRFAFVNKLGAWDYYNNYNPVKQRINVTRQEYTAPRVNYSTLFSSYNYNNRGKTVNDSTTDDQFTTDTDYLDKTNANWLEELIESPEVYIQRNGEFIPVVITDSNYTAKTSASRQKLFKYTINFKPSNQPFGTWIPEYVQCPKQLPTVTAPQLETLAANAITTVSMTFQGSVTDTGEPNTIAQLGFVYSTSSAIPTISDNKTFSGSPPFTTGSYSINSGPEFLPDSTVYFRAYASSSNAGGTIVYGPVVNNTTNPITFPITLWADYDFLNGICNTDSQQTYYFDTNNIATATKVYSDSTGQSLLATDTMFALTRNACNNTQTVYSWANETFTTFTACCNN